MWYEQFGGEADDWMVKMLDTVLRQYLNGDYATMPALVKGEMTEEISYDGYTITLYDWDKNGLRHLEANWLADQQIGKEQFHTHFFHGTMNKDIFVLPTLVYEEESQDLVGVEHVLERLEVMGTRELCDFYSRVFCMNKYYMQTMYRMTVTETSITQQSWTAESLLEANLPRELERVVRDEEPVTHKLWGYYLGDLYLA